MSALPKYRVRDEENDLESGHEDSRPLLSAKAQDLEEIDPPTYPPRLGGPSSYPTTSTIYHFVPRWPMKGENEHVMGVAGSKEFTVRMVQNAFSALADLPASRIEFLAPITPEVKLGEKDGWSKVLDQAWGAFESNPPSRLLVQVVDLPGQLEARIKRENRKDTIIASAIFGPLFLALIIIAVLGLTGKLSSH